MKKRSRVCLSYEALSKLLHLRDGISVIDIRVNRLENSVDFILDDGPPTDRGQAIVRVGIRDVTDWELSQ